MSKKLKLAPKTFVLETKDLVFIPNQPTIKKATNERYCCCVHVCSQFLEYPVDKWGRRIIPSSAICPHVKTLQGYPMHCTGDFSDEMIHTICIFVTSLLESGVEVLLSSAGEIISEAICYKNVINFCIELGIIDTLFHLLDESVSFTTKSVSLGALCDLVRALGAFLSTAINNSNWSL